MTGRELILYILSNGLEDDQVFKDGTFVGFYTPAEFAAKCHVGVATVNTWAHRGDIETVKFSSEIGNSYLIPRTQPITVMVNWQKTK
jgi:hypothetical protein